MPTEPLYDVVIVGGSYAGLAGAMQLGRARRQVAVIDAGQRRNRFAKTSHGFLTQDGRAPEAIAADARAQVLAYPTVTWIDGRATAAERADGTFRVALESGETVTGKRLILAGGVVDELPEIPGLQERWGRSVFACPYCHGYELNQGRVGVIATSPMSLHQAQLLPDWGQVTFFTNGAIELDTAQAQDLAERGVTVEPTLIEAIVGDATPTVRLQDGREVMVDGLFTASRIHLASPLAEQLGCALEEGPMGNFIRVDEMKQTSVPGVFAAGDAARMAASVTFAVADGAMAGISAHRSLVFG
ncbi:Thioredoxin reductase [compost metagenome]